MSAPKFKVGDRVRLIDARGAGFSRARVGDTGTVLGIVVPFTDDDGDLIEVEFDFGETSRRFSRRFELVEPEFSEGDKVDVVFSGVVKYVGADGLDVRLENGTYTTVRVEDATLVEKAKPEVFQPGDYVRSKAYPEYTFLILDNGYVDLYNKCAVRASDLFTSEDYEKFELAEVPL